MSAKTTDAKGIARRDPASGQWFEIPEDKLVYWNQYVDCVDEIVEIRSAGPPEWAKPLDGPDFLLYGRGPNGKWLLFPASMSLDFYDWVDAYDAETDTGEPPPWAHPIDDPFEGTIALKHWHEDWRGALD